MKVLHLKPPRCFEQIEVPVPTLPLESRDRLLVRTAWISQCGSDIPFFTGKKRFQSYPMAPGAPIHEYVGEVVESTSELFRPGDRVLSIPDGNQGLAEYSRKIRKSGTSHSFTYPSGRMHQPRFRIRFLAGGVFCFADLRRAFSARDSFPFA
jgi:threonine dehydrogenase-like Zn-dependent dehydrogenase